MTVTNMKQLEQALLKEVRKAMKVASDKAEADMFEETGRFYTKDDPKVYQRTGALGDTPKTTAISCSGNEVSFEAYLDDSQRYTTGKNPTMTDVLNLANSGITSSSVGKLRPTVGEEGFWDRAKEKMKKDCEETMGKFFEKV